jgi:putative membrane protein
MINLLSSFYNVLNAYNGWHMGWGHMNYGYGGIMMIITLVVIGIVIYFLVKYSKENYKEEDRETPLEILKKRYAKGEISKEKFEEMKEILEKYKE